MATVTITIPNNIVNRVLDGFCKRHGYSSILENGSPNPETKAQFTQRKVREYVKQSVLEAEIEIARNSAAGVAHNSVESEIVIT